MSVSAIASALPVPLTLDRVSKVAIFGCIRVAAVQGSPDFHGLSASANRITRLSTGYFWNVARQPIFFEQTIAQLEQEGPFRYLDIGPSGSLATFLKYLIPKSSESRVASVMTPYGQDIQNLAAVLARRS